jgi:hypothetical protein
MGLLQTNLQPGNDLGACHALIGMVIADLSLGTGAEVR